VAKRDVSRVIRFYGLDGRLSIFLLALLVWPRTSTFIGFIVVAIVLWILERKGWPLDMFFRKVKGMLGGNVKLARPWWRKER